MLPEGLRPASFLGSSHKIPLRERLKSLYFVIFGPKFNYCIAAASLVLLCISFFSIASVTSLWYHLAEGVLTFLFAGEIALRLAVMRSNFWESAFNVLEAVTCVLCVTIFFVLHFSRQEASLAEHQVLIVLRYLGQLLRMTGIVAMDGFTLANAEAGIQLFTGNGARLPPLDMRETYRDVL